MLPLPGIALDMDNPDDLCTLASTPVDTCATTPGPPWGPGRFDAGGKRVNTPIVSLNRANSNRQFATAIQPKTSPAKESPAGGEQYSPRRKPWKRVPGNNKAPRGRKKPPAPTSELHIIPLPLDAEINPGDSITNLLL